CSICHVLAMAFDIQVPAIPPLAEGNVGSQAPFILNRGETMRYQQVYSAGAFLSLSQQGGGWITALTFPQDPSATAKIDSLRMDLQITLSTTPNTPDGLSTTFSENLGAGTTLVLPRQVLNITLPIGGAPLTIPLQTPFYYDGSAGHNLLLDVRNYGALYSVGGIGGAGFDAQSTLGDAVSVVFSLDPNSTTGIADTYGLVTTFAFTPVPEPSAGTLAGCAIFILGVWSLLAKYRNTRRLGSVNHTVGYFA
ncbi:MAG TPA: hypothetical protein VGE41_12760, partial [Verrucomicrobiae bacterium]